MEVGSLPIIIWGQKCITPTFVQGSLAAHSLFHSNPIGAAIGLLFGGTWMAWRCIRMPVTSVINAGDLELPSGEEEEEEYQAEQTPVEATPSVRRKRKETTQPATSAEGPSPPPSKSKRLRKRTVVEYVATEETAAAPNATSDTDEELREAFEAVEQEKELEELEEVGEGPQEKAKIMEEKEEILAEVIAESIALAQKQQEDTRAGLTSSELALFEDPEAEHSTAVPAAEEQAGQSISEPMDLCS
ncbi:unnamed protein product [Prunus armeniaca]